MDISMIKVGFMRCNCYILSLGNKVLIVDPGDESDKIIEKIGDKDVVGILITHRHFDHIGAVSELYNKYKCNTYDYSCLEEDDYDIDGFRFRVIYTPGHSNDCITYYFYLDNIMFTGDFLFYNTIGRCDLYESNVNDMYNSLSKIKNYSDSILIYPGHGNSSNLGYEKNNNPYMRGEKIEDC